MTARIAVLVVATLGFCSAGCSYNPGYFPYILPPGRIQQDHAKPGGPGYFRNYDPQAVKLEVSPNQLITAPLGSQVVLLGTVMDKDGQPRRSRRVEWITEGPGNIVEVDESGFYPGRGYKVDNRYAVSYTNYTTKTITRGNTDPADDVIVAPGQTFCVLSSAIAGETVVTVYAPEVFNWDNGRVTVKILWGDGRFSFPASAVTRVGGEHTLTTSISSTAADGIPAGYRIRYRVIDGPAAVLVSRAGSGTGASLSGTGSKEAEAFTDANGDAAVRLVQQVPKAGKTRVFVEVVKPPESGTGTGTVVGRKETVIEWAEPKIHLAVNAPNAAGLNGTFPVTVSLDNDANIDSRNAKVNITLSDGATLVKSDPPPSRQDITGTLTFELPPTPGKTKQEVVLQVKPARLGQVTVTADAVTTDGLSATNKATTRVEQGKLQLHIEAPTAALTDEQIPFRIAVTNAGAAPAENVTVWARCDEGLKGAAAQNPIELAAGSLAPGQTKTLDLPLVAARSGRYGVRATVTGDGNLSGSAEPVAVDVRSVKLTAGATGPRMAYLNAEFDWTVSVKNTGDATATNLVVRATVPNEVRVKPGDGGTVGAGSVEWKLPELRAGDQKTFRLSVTALKLSDRAALTVSVLGDANNGTRTVGEPLGAKAETAVAIIGTPALVLELATPAGLVEVGKRVSFQVRVKNQGTVSARNVEVNAFAPPELKAIRGAASPGADVASIDATGRVTFTIVEELRPGATITFTIDVDAVQAGDARFRAEVRAAHLTNALKEEQAARVTAK